MRVLLDTHILIWFMDGEKELSQSVIDIIRNYENEIFVSVASIWEIVIKTSISKLPYYGSVNDIYEFLNKYKIELINISPNHLSTLLTLPHHHRDPFDRLIISQAIVEKLSVVTADQHFAAYQVDIVAQ
ncbi:MAG: type II toxin-antitoxin system VapC family toxin [Sphingobacteriaceae bacterium]|nr:MAG: type II toxin-antitoxin system VapC family toxin [Sphingobacteriaceae bacterium]